MQSGCPRRLYTELKKEEKQKAMQQEKDMLNWMQSSKE